MAAAREGEDVDRWQASFDRAAQDPRQLVLVARRAGAVVGYGEAALLDMPDGGAAPSGWYLTGVAVHPELRRQGVAHRLTLATNG